MVELITTALVSLLMLMGWEWHPAFVGCFWLTFTFIESSFLSSNVTKVSAAGAESELLSGL